MKTEHKTSNRIFAFFLIITAIDISEPLIGLITDGPSNLGMLRNTVAFLQIPAFYLYVLSVSYSDFRLKLKYLIHLLPFVISNVVLLPRFYTVDLASKIDFIINRQNMIEFQFNHLLFNLQVIFYSLLFFYC